MVQNRARCFRAVPRHDLPPPPRLRRALAESEVGRTLFVPGFEYTDSRYGHVGSSFADLAKVLAEVSVEAAQAAPERFFEQWVADGGVLVVNHPLVTPVDSIFAE